MASVKDEHLAARYFRLREEPDLRKTGTPEDAITHLRQRYVRDVTTNPTAMQQLRRMELGEIEAGPQPYRPDFGPIEDYLLAWHTWRTIRNDARLRPEEAETKTEALRWALDTPSVMANRRRGPRP